MPVWGKPRVVCNGTTEPLSSYLSIVVPMVAYNDVDPPSLCCPVVSFPLLRTAGYTNAPPVWLPVWRVLVISSLTVGGYHVILLQESSMPPSPRPEFYMSCLFPKSFDALQFRKQVHVLVYFVVVVEASEFCGIFFSSLCVLRAAVCSLPAHFSRRDCMTSSTQTEPDAIRVPAAR